MNPRWLVLPAGIVIGLIAETGWPPGVDPRLVLADLAIGWLFIGGGFVVWRARPANRMGVLLMATGATWFVATFDPHAAYLYCGPLVHLLIAHPTGRLVGRTSRVVVGVVYAIGIIAAVMAVGPVAGVGFAIGTLIVAIGVARLLETAGARGQPGLATAVLTIVIGLVLAGVERSPPDRVVGRRRRSVGLRARTRRHPDKHRHGHHLAGVVA